MPSRTDSKQTGAELTKIYSVPNSVLDPDSVNADPDSVFAESGSRLLRNLDF